ncbi:MAG: YncE family protein [Chloroflexota bacterium]
MASDETAVWITSFLTGQVDRIDPNTNTVVDRITVGGSPCGIAIGPDGRVWVAELTAGAILAIDPATKEITGRIDSVGPQLWDLKAGFGSIWAVDRDSDRLLRIDPTTATVTSSIKIGPNGSGLAIMSATVWVSDDTDGLIRRLDPTTNLFGAPLDIGGSPSWFADDGSRLLVVARRTSGSTLSVDPLTGALGADVDGWKQPLDGTIVEHSAWIPDGIAGTVVVMDLPTNTVGATVALPGAINPFVAERARGDVWVLDFGGVTIWRIHP